MTAVKKPRLWHALRRCLSIDLFSFQSSERDRVFYTRERQAISVFLSEALNRRISDHELKVDPIV